MTFTKWGEILSGGTLTFPKNINYLFNFCVHRGLNKISLNSKVLGVFVSSSIVASVESLLNETITLLAARTPNKLKIITRIC